MSSNGGTQEPRRWSSFPIARIAGIEVRVRPDQRRLSDAGLSSQDLTLSVAAAGDGALIDEYKAGGDSIEFGPGRVLNGLTKRIDRDLTSFSTDDVASLENALTSI